MAASPTTAGVTRRPKRRFYVLVALLTAGVVIVGFAPTFYMRTAELGPLKPVLAAHGAVFTVWLALFLAQTLLVPAGRTDLHRKLGWASLAWAGVMVALGIAAALDTLRGGQPPVPGDIRQFAMLPFGDIAIFAGLVAWGAFLRQRSDWHKRLMTMATVSLLTPALARIPALMPFGPPGFLSLTLVAVAGVIAFDWIAHGRPHPANLWSGALIGLGKPILLFGVAATPAWLALMDALR
ncbi:hypothetical protein [Phenylobacterium sp.]|uniref:hypothetical protein n=1 Tax=Phenylobacterium sp. TaxID=1871053 RepID=UPI0028125B22|nr:hypothetical protein [Phenylobacterium sp.]